VTGHDEITELLGAYALNAVLPDDARLIAAHLETCPSCREELAIYEETAASLSGAGGPSPSGVWEKISGQLTPPPLELVSRRSEFSFSRRLAPVLVAVAAALIALVGFELSHLESRVGHLQAALAKNGLTAAAASAELAPGSRTLWLSSASHKPAMEAVISGNGAAYLVQSKLPVLAAARTYQLWGLANGKVVSLGLLGNGRSVTAFRVSPRVKELMVTAEPAGGVPAPTSAVVASASL
jgi:anti-sigma factor RsiW